MTDSNVHILHGFLGSSLMMREAFCGLALNATYYDLCEEHTGSVRLQGATLQEFAQGVWPGGYLFGYSLGGRIAMQAYAAAPGRWKGLIVCGSRFGLVSGHIQRIQQDEAWACRFEGSEPWEDVLGSWNAQSLFQGAAMPESMQPDQNYRQRYAEILRGCSLGRQPDMSHLFQRHVLFLSNEHHDKAVVIPGTHRFLWETVSWHSIVRHWIQKEL